MNGKILEQVHMYKFLGVIVDENIDFEMHTEYACGKAKSALNKVSILLSGRQGLPVQVGVELYKGLIRAHLEYAAIGGVLVGSAVISSLIYVAQLFRRQICILTSV